MAGWIMAVVQGAANAYSTAETLKKGFKNQARTAESAMLADKATMTAAMSTIGRLNVERAGVYRQVQKALVNVQDERMRYKATASTNAAATGVTGASVQAVLADADRQASEAVASVRYNLEVQEARLDNTAQDILKGAEERFVSHTLDAVMSRSEAGRTVFQGFLGGFSGSGYTPDMPRSRNYQEQNTAQGFKTDTATTDSNEQGQGFVFSENGYYSEESGVSYNYGGSNT